MGTIINRSIISTLCTHLIHAEIRVSGNFFKAVTQGVPKLNDNLRPDEKPSYTSTGKNNKKNPYHSVQR